MCVFERVCVSVCVCVWEFSLTSPRLSLALHLCCGRKWQKCLVFIRRDRLCAWHPQMCLWILQPYFSTFCQICWGRVFDSCHDLKDVSTRCRRSCLKCIWSASFLEAFLSTMYGVFWVVWKASCEHRRLLSHFFQFSIKCWLKSVMEGGINNFYPLKSWKELENNRKKIKKTLKDGSD